MLAHSGGVPPAVCTLGDDAALIGIPVRRALDYQRVSDVSPDRFALPVCTQFPSRAD